jgi:hypothetical protein
MKPRRVSLTFLIRYPGLRWVEIEYMIVCVDNNYVVVTKNLILWDSPKTTI